MRDDYSGSFSSQQGNAVGFSAGLPASLKAGRGWQAMLGAFPQAPASVTISQASCPEPLVATSAVSNDFVSVDPTSLCVPLLLNDLSGGPAVMTETLSPPSAEANGYSPSYTANYNSAAYAAGLPALQGLSGAPVTTGLTPNLTANIGNIGASITVSNNVQTLQRLVNELPEGVSRQSGAQIIRLTMEAMGIATDGVLSEAQSAQTELLEAVRSNIKRIEDYKAAIAKLETDIKQHQGKANELSEMIDLFILANAAPGRGLNNEYGLSSSENQANESAQYGNESLENSYSSSSEFNPSGESSEQSHHSSSPSQNQGY